MTQSLPQRYDQWIASGHIRPDGQQRLVLTYLETVASRFDTPSAFKGISILLQAIRRRDKSVPGVYLWGPVGTGKTTMMDLFYDRIASPFKHRIHFHAFMQNIHEQLHELAGQAYPIDQAIQTLSQTVNVLCIDEFLVEDVADAMILKDILQALCRYNVFLMTTANTPPHHLYRNGLQRQQFMPAVQHIRSVFKVLELNQANHRSEYFVEDMPYFLHPMTPLTHQRCHQIFRQHAKGIAPNSKNIQLLGRTIAVLGVSEAAVWIQFEALLYPPRNKKDFLALCHRHDVLIISGLRPIQQNERNLATNFIQLIDVAYDEGVRLIFESDAPLEEIYAQGALLEVFERCVSRLKEMQHALYGRGTKPQSGLEFSDGTGSV